MPKRLWVVGLSSLLAVACSTNEPLAPFLSPCTAASGGSAGQVNAAYGVLTVIDPTQTSGCAVFPDNTLGTAIEYLLVAQSASGRVNDSSLFRLFGAAIATPAAPRAPRPAAAQAGPQQRFDLTLRRAERDLALRLGAEPHPQLAPPVSAAPVAVGDVRQFKVCGDTLCLTHPRVTATAKTVGDHVAIFVDDAATDPLSTADLDDLAAVFDTLLYPADTTAFGHESDIDGNGRVLVLLTGKVNLLTEKASCPTSIVGYFYGGDLLTTFTGGNNAEIFYAVVPDPTGKLSCAHPVSQVKALIPPTFIHEFQHMISWGHHVRPKYGIGVPEQLWLNEGLSHYAEELGGRLFLPTDSTTFCTYLVGDLSNSGQYFLEPEAGFLVDNAGIGDLASRGAYWLFVRFLVDQFAPLIGGPDSVTRRLDMTRLTGATNVTAATGTVFDTLVKRWGLANYLSDVGMGFPTPPAWQYVTWRFRTDYARARGSCQARIGATGIPATFPLNPASGDGETLDLIGVLRAGSGTYFLASQAAGAAGFTLLFSDGSGRALRPSLRPRLNVIRTQ